MFGLGGGGRAAKEEAVKRSTVLPTDKVLSRSSLDELIARYIAPHPHRVGAANVWLPQYGYSVWILADALNDVGGDRDRIAREYGLPEEAVEAVVHYYERHREAIDAKILANALDFNAPS
jgi:hypothetical protein